MTNKRGQLIVYSGPSGVGKGTLIKPLLGDKMTLSVSMTTRAPRQGEENGREYFFVSEDEFERIADDGGFLEYARYNRNYYGTPRSYVEEALLQGVDVILEIEVQGAMKVRENFPEAVFIFVMPPSVEILRERLSGRGTETEEEVLRRMKIAIDEMNVSRKYDYIIINDNIDEARTKFNVIIEASRYRASNMKNFVDEVTKHDA